MIPEGAGDEEYTQRDVTNISYSSCLTATYLCAYADTYIKTHVPDLKPARLAVGVTVEIERLSLELKRCSADHSDPAANLMKFDGMYIICNCYITWRIYNIKNLVT